jgi:succinate dehydrogenase hydrophobic anchor subunit
MDRTKSRNLPLSQRGLNFEMFMWMFTRLSALAMYGFILIGLVGALIMGAQTHMNFADIMRWAFMPAVPHVQDTSLPSTAPWGTPFWRLVASGLLLVATVHGVHGLVVVCDDYIVSERGRQIVRYISIVAITVMSLLGLYLIWTS